MSSFLRRLFGRCEHLNTRCVHGDEINHAGGKRVCCLDCGRYLGGPMPDWCSAANGWHR